MGRICSKTLTSGRKCAELVQNQTPINLTRTWVSAILRDRGEHICSDLVKLIC
jgi:hypothetical protein